MLIEEVQEQHRAWFRLLLYERWGSSNVDTRGRLHQALQLPRFPAIENNTPISFITCLLKDGDCEIVTLDSLLSGKGIGTAMVKRVQKSPVLNNRARVWLITKNDSTDALRFYQKVGFRIVTIQRGSIAKSRKLKLEIPETGNNGIPITDEIELEVKQLQ